MDGRIGDTLSRIAGWARERLLIGKVGLRKETGKQTISFNNGHDLACIKGKKGLKKRSQPTFILIGVLDFASSTQLMQLPGNYSDASQNRTMDR